MKRILIIISILLLAPFAIIFIYPKIDRFFRGRPVKEANILRHEIIASISNPFIQADTFIVESDWGFCGNTDPDDLPIVFDIQLENENYKRVLAKKIQMPVLTMNEFNKVMDMILQARFKGQYPTSLWDTCRIGKVSVDIKAEQFSSKKVRLHETYLYNNITKYFCKDFVFDGNKWIYSITDTSTQVLTR